MISSMGDSNPKILIAASIYPPDPGGPALHAKRFYEWLGEKGLQRELVALSSYRYMPPGIRHLVYLSRLYSKSKKCDVVYAYDQLGVGLPALIAARWRLRKKSFALRVGGDIPWERASQDGRSELSLKEWYKAGQYKRSWKFKISKFVLRRAGTVIVTSKLLKDLYANEYGVREEKIALVPNPVPAKGETKGFVPPKALLFASRLVSYKNLDFVMDVLARVLPSYPDVIFLIMGDGPERESLEAKARALNLDKLVIFRGSVPQDEVVAETEACYAAIAPALTEFNPNYILQCLAIGKPFLISRENGLPFSVPEKFLFDPRNQTEFEAKLRLLLSAEGYDEAKALVSGIDFKWGWRDVLNENLRIISACNRQA